VARGQAVSSQPAPYLEPPVTMGSTEPLILAVGDEEDEIIVGTDTIKPKRMNQLTTCKPEAIVAYVRDKGLYKLGDFVVNVRGLSRI
jgi:hypothetical protein